MVTIQSAVHHAQLACGATTHLRVMGHHDQGDTTLVRTLNFTYGSEYGNSLVALGEEHEYGYAVLASIAFDESSSTGDDMFLVRLDEMGDTLWTRKYGGDKDENGSSLLALTLGAKKL